MGEQYQGKDWTLQTMQDLAQKLTVDAKGVRTLFPGMVIPTNRLSKVAQSIMGFIPMPNTPSDGTSTDVLHAVAV